jgi:hypothetical protein
LAKDRAARYQRAGDLARDLARAVGLALPAESTPAHAAEAPRRARRPALRIDWRRGTTWLSLGAGLAILAGIAILGWPFAVGLLSSIQSEPSPPPPTSASPTMPSTTLPLAAGIPTPTPAVPIGLATFHDSSLHIDLTALPPAGAGHSYQAWLETAGGIPLLVGPVQLTGNAAAVDYSDPTGANLLVSYDGVVLSLEADPDPDTATRGPVVYAGSPGLEPPALIRLLHDVASDSAMSSAVLGGLQSQLNHFSSHLGLMLDGISNGDLDAAKLHAEHVINIIEGRSGEQFGDWNGDGLAQNPGDDFGLLPYLRLLDVLTQPSTEGLATAIDPQAPEALIATGLDALVAETEETRDLAMRIATADLISEVEPLAPQVTAIPVEAGVLEVLQMAQGLVLSIRVPVLPVQP